MSPLGKKIRKKEVLSIMDDLFGETQDVNLDQESAHRSLDELFNVARHYKNGKEYFELLKFVSHFRSYSIFNALLVHVQMPGAGYVAPASRWKRDYKRRIRLGARPLVIMRPMGPVMFLFDVSDTEPEVNAPLLPREVTEPFAVRHGYIREELAKTIENAKRDGVMVTYQDAGSLSAGSIQTMQSGQYIQTSFGRKEPKHHSIPVRYGVLLNLKQSKETQYATLAHELAHLYCGHLGSPNEKWWPNRSNQPDTIRELEAESACYLVCSRLGIENPSEEYLSTYVKDEDTLSTISLDCVIKAATLIERMGIESLPERKSNEA